LPHTFLFPCFYIYLRRINGFICCSIKHKHLYYVNGLYYCYECSLCTPPSGVLSVPSVHGCIRVYRVLARQMRREWWCSHNCQHELDGSWRTYKLTGGWSCEVLRRGTCICSPCFVHMTICYSFHFILAICNYTYTYVNLCLHVWVLQTFLLQHSLNITFTGCWILHSNRKNRCRSIRARITAKPAYNGSPTALHIFYLTQVLPST
jgi:hypothetical protein